MTRIAGIADGEMVIVQLDGGAWSAWRWIRSDHGALTFGPPVFGSYDDAEADGARVDREAAMVSGFDRHIRRIQARVAEVFGYSRSQMLARSRGRRLSKARKIAMALARDLTPASYPELGRLFERDHTTVHEGVRKIRAEDPDWLAILRAELRAGGGSK